LKKDIEKDDEIKYNTKLCLNDNTSESSIKPLKTIKKEETSVPGNYYAKLYRWHSLSCTSQPSTVKSA
jgi:hypothetical protein